MLGKSDEASPHRILSDSYAQIRLKHRNEGCEAEDSRFIKRVDNSGDMWITDKRPLDGMSVIVPK